MMAKEKKFTVAALCMSAVLSLTACGGNGGAASSANPSASATASTAGASAAASSSLSAANLPEETINVFNMLANYAGEQPGWFAKLVKDKFNIKLNIISVGGNNQVIASKLASGDLGDLVVWNSNGKDFLDSIKAGLLLDWNKDGLLDKYGPTMKKVAAQAIEANKKQFGGGTAVYGIGHDVGSGDGPSEGSTMTYGPDLRWDLYQKLGSPKINKLEDYLPLLKKMQELEPKSDSGRKTYGFSLWSDWDSDFSTNVKVISSFYGFSASDGFNPGDLIETSATGQQYHGLIDDNSYYMQGLSFFNKANQMGLVDPDSLTQKFSDVSNKTKDGQIFFSQFPWVDNTYSTPEHLAAGKGFQLVPFTDEKVYSYGFTPSGGGRIWSIGAKAKDPARIMMFLDWLYSSEGVMTTSNGPKGLTWDIKDGKPYVTDFGWKALPSNDVQVPAEYGGGSFKDGISQINNTTITKSMINPETGEPYDYTLWKSTLEHNPDPVTKSWRDSMGVMTPKDYLVKNNMVAVVKETFTGSAPTPLPSDIQQKQSEIGKIIKEYSWKMIFAKTDAEFNNLKQQMVSKAKGLGYDSVVAWEIDQTKKTVWVQK